MNKHSPAPWSAATANEDTIIKGLAGEPIAYLYPRPEIGDGIGWNAPHAALLAAAPDMLLALYNAKALIETLCERLKQDPATFHDLEGIRKAIAKAEGRS